MVTGMLLKVYSYPVPIAHLAIQVLYNELDQGCSIHGKVYSKQDKINEVKSNTNKIHTVCRERGMARRPCTCG